MASNLIGQLAVNLSMNTAAFQKGANIAEKRAAAMETRMKGIGSSIKGIGASLGGALLAGGAISAMGAIAASAFEMGSSLTEAASKVGVTVEALQEMRYVATQNGLSIETMEGSLNKMTKTLGELQLGNKKTSQTFAELGLSAQSMIGLTPTESFTKIVDALAKVEDETIRAALGNKVFGRSYAELKPLVDLGAAGIQKAVEEKRKDGVISTEQAAKLDQLADGWARLKEKVGIATAQFIANRAGSSGASDGLDKFSVSISNLIADVQGLLGWLDKLELVQLRISRFSAKMGRDGVGGTLFQSVRDNNQSEISRIDARVREIQGNAAGTNNRPRKLPMTRKVGGGILAGSASVFAGLDFDSIMETLESKSSSFGAKVASPIKAGVDKVSASFNALKFDATSSINGVAAHMDKLGKVTSKVSDELTDKVRGLLDRLFPEVKEMLDYQSDKNALQEWANKGKISADALTASLTRLRAERYGLEQALPAVNDNPTLDDLGIDIQAQIDKNLPTLPDAPGKTFEDFLAGVQNVAAGVANSMQDMQDSVNGFVQSIKKGDIIGIIGGLANVIGAGLEIFGKIKGFSTPPGRARGGNTTSGRTYMVGERGPELFTSNKSGYITPNKDLNGRGGRAANVNIVPSKYFDVVVDGRAANVAQPMAAQAAALGSASAQTALMRRANRRIE